MVTVIASITRVYSCKAGSAKPYSSESKVEPIEPTSLARILAVLAGRGGREGPLDLLPKMDVSMGPAVARGRGAGGDGEGAG